MIRGTTPTHVFSNLPVPSGDIQEIWITYLQAGRVVLSKDKTSVTLRDSEEEERSSIAIVQLTQEETLLFTQGQYTVQIRLLLTNNTALASNEVMLTVGRITRNGKIQ